MDIGLLFEEGESIVDAQVWNITGHLNVLLNPGVTRFPGFLTSCCFGLLLAVELCKGTSKNHIDIFCR